MGEAKAFAVLLVIFLVCPPISAAVQATQDKPVAGRKQALKEAPGNGQALGPIYITLVKPIADSPINFSKAEFKQELQRRLGLQLRFSLAIQIIALALGLLSLAVISARRRASALSHNILLP